LFKLFLKYILLINS